MIPKWKKENVKLVQFKQPTTNMMHETVGEDPSVMRRIRKARGREWCPPPLIHGPPRSFHSPEWRENILSHHAPAQKRQFLIHDWSQKSTYIFPLESSCAMYSLELLRSEIICSCSMTQKIGILTELMPLWISWRLPDKKSTIANFSKPVANLKFWNAMSWNAPHLDVVSWSACLTGHTGDGSCAATCRLQARWNYIHLISFCM